MWQIYLIALGKRREVAPREFDVHSRWKPAREAKEKKEKKKKKNKKKGKQRQSHKTEAACVASAGWSFTKVVPPPAK